MINLILALLWLILGASLLIVQSTSEGSQGRAYWLGIFFALLMTVWNLVRWFLIQRARRRRRALLKQAESTALAHNVRRSEPPGEPDPTFDFTNGEPPPIRRADGPAPGG